MLLRVLPFIDSDYFLLFIMPESFFRTIAFKRVLLALAVVVTVIVGGPWSLYWLGLYGVSGQPALPVSIATPDLQTGAWQHAGYEGSPVLAVLDPVTYLLSASGQEAPPPATLFAWRIAVSYNRDHQRYAGPVWKNLSGAAMSIWLTRNWTIEQLMSKIVELDQRRGLIL